MHATTSMLCTAAMGLAATVALAGVSPREAARLGGPELTPVGAERAANAEGTIPAWTGGLTAPPPGFKPGEFHRTPYPDDPLLFAISAANLSEYEDKLSDGQQALLEAYPDTWRMNVYRTRRSAAYPDFVYAAIKTNATRAEVEHAKRGGVRNAIISSPFPIPRRGVEVVWNHNLRWRGIRFKRINGQTSVTRMLGSYRVVLFLEEGAFPYGLRERTDLQEQYPDTLLAIKQKVIAPGLLTGNAQLVLESLNPSKTPRNTWVYNRNLRRVFRTPFTGFDNPGPFTEGLRLNDEADMFNGSPELFEWQLVGKRELFIPYNAYDLHSGELTYDDILENHHINPALARYELHRVWVVVGTLKPGNKHIYSRRVFYLDEDTWQIAVADNYDQKGRLWRFSEGHMLNYYDVPVPWYTLEVYQDLKQRRYLVNGLDNLRHTYQFQDTINPREFSPNALDYYVR